MPVVRGQMPVVRGQRFDAGSQRSENFCYDVSRYKGCHDEQNPSWNLVVFVTATAYLALALRSEKRPRVIGPLRKTKPPRGGNPGRLMG
ncbi:hypothetical protein ElyMa_003076400 [Elysia marginata]|uniref:Uncharacterized protein n=1 Tax=Elysia marginata TaxID=1093978 RepID=A0AAV4IMA9_9GAST|nr:hypothetical protein ElyMa_003076400 [Elysia marginata]